MLNLDEYRSTYVQVDFFLMLVLHEWQFCWVWVLWKCWIIQQLRPYWQQYLLCISKLIFWVVIWDRSWYQMRRFQNNLIKIHLRLVVQLLYHFLMFLLWFKLIIFELCCCDQQQSGVLNHYQMQYHRLVGRDHQHGLWGYSWFLFRRWLRVIFVRGLVWIDQRGHLIPFRRQHRSWWRCL